MVQVEIVNGDRLTNSPLSGRFDARTCPGDHHSPDSGTRPRTSVCGKGYYPHYPMTDSPHQPSAQWKRWLALALGTAITIVLVAWVVRDVSWAKVGERLGRSHWGWFGVGLATYLLALVLSVGATS